MATAGIVGSTGMVGAHILSTLVTAPASVVSSIHAFSRRDLPHTSTNLHPITEKDTSKWPTLVPSPLNIFFSGLGSTRGAAGSLENQRKIDYDLNFDLAKAAKAAGASTYVLISAASANADSNFAYVRMKGELEEAVKSLGFEHTVIVRPGLISGERQESRPAEWIVRKIAQVAGAVSGDRLKDFWAQDADVIGKAAVSAGLECLQGKKEKGVWIIAGQDIMRLGKYEWKEIQA